MALKPEKRVDYREVTYNKAHWDLLQQYRTKAKQILTALEIAQLQALAHGSIARGDVNPKSDIDIFIPEPQSSFLIEAALEKAGVPINARLVVQATPTYTMKAHIEIDPKTSVTFPLMHPRKVEREFYRFGGEIDWAQIETGIRMLGVDKRLMLIEPTQKGHVESSIIGQEAHVAKLLGISAETVLDRVHTLLKRDEVGRTGVFIKRELVDNETFEMMLKKLAECKPAVRRRIKKDGL
jgi:hypothetical protein